MKMKNEEATVGGLQEQHAPVHQIVLNNEILQNVYVPLAHRQVLPRDGDIGDVLHRATEYKPLYRR